MKREEEATEAAKGATYSLSRTKKTNIKRRLHNVNDVAKQMSSNLSEISTHLRDNVSSSGDDSPVSTSEKPREDDEVEEGGATETTRSARH